MPVELVGSIYAQIVSRVNAKSINTSFSFFFSFCVANESYLPFGAAKAKITSVSKRLFIGNFNNPMVKLDTL